MLILDMQTVKAIYPGTFDPLTNGHLDLIARGSKFVDELVVAVLRNSDKGVPLFTVDERVEMISESIQAFGNVSVSTFDGLLVDFARKEGAQAVLRGIRAISDYEYEFQMAMMNRKLDPKLETLFMMPAEKYTYVSSRLIKGVPIGRSIIAFMPIGPSVDSTAADSFCTPWASARRASLPWIMILGIVSPSAKAGLVFLWITCQRQA